jgi:hypothetical protein
MIVIGFLEKMLGDSKLVMCIRIITLCILQGFIILIYVWKLWIDRAIF